VIGAEIQRARLRCFVRLHQILKGSPAMAASVTDRLWEMTDLVDILDAFEAKRKREPKVTFEIDEWKIAGGFYIRAIPRGWHGRAGRRLCHGRRRWPVDQKRVNCLAA
jgi:hypothetical protein